MPSVPSTNRFKNRLLGQCASEQMLMVVYCGGCHRKVHYWATDLVKVLEPHHQAHIPPWPCARCRTTEYMTMRWHLPYAEELAKGLTVRRPVRKIEKWIWRDERA